MKIKPYIGQIVYYYPTTEDSRLYHIVQQVLPAVVMDLMGDPDCLDLIVLIPMGGTLPKPKSLKAQGGELLDGRWEFIGTEISGQHVEHHDCDAESKVKELDEVMTQMRMTVQELMVHEDLTEKWRQFTTDGVKYPALRALEFLKEEVYTGDPYKELADKYDNLFDMAEDLQSNLKSFFSTDKTSKS